MTRFACRPPASFLPRGGRGHASTLLLLLLLLLLLPAVSAQHTSGSPCEGYGVGEVSPYQLYAASTGYCSEIVCTIGGVWASRSDALWIGVNIYETPANLDRPQEYDGHGILREVYRGFEGEIMHQNLIPVRWRGPTVSTRERPVGLSETSTDDEMRAALLESFSMSTCRTDGDLATQCVAKMCGWETPTSGAGCHEAILPNYLEFSPSDFWATTPSVMTPNPWNLAVAAHDPVGPARLWAILDTWLTHNERASSAFPQVTGDGPLALWTTEPIDTPRRDDLDLNSYGWTVVTTGGNNYAEVDEKIALADLLARQNGLARQIPPRMEGLIQLAYQPALMTAHDVPVTPCDPAVQAVHDPTPLVTGGSPVPPPACACTQWNLGGWPRTSTPATGSFLQWENMFAGAIYLGLCHLTNGGASSALATAQMLWPHTPSDRLDDGRLIGLGNGRMPCTPASFLHPCLTNFCQDGGCGTAPPTAPPTYILERDSNCHGPTTCFLEDSAATQPTCDYRHPIFVDGAMRPGCGFPLLVLAAEGTACTVNAPVAETAIDGNVHRLITDGNRLNAPTTPIDTSSYPVTVALDLLQPPVLLGGYCDTHANCNDTRFCRPPTGIYDRECRYAFGLVGPFTRGDLPSTIGTVLDFGHVCTVDGDCYDGQCIASSCRSADEAGTLRYCAVVGVVVGDPLGGLVYQHGYAVPRQYHIECGARNYGIVNARFDAAVVAPPYDPRRLCLSNHIPVWPICMACDVTGDGCAQDFHHCIDGRCVFVEPPAVFVPPIDAGLDLRCIETYQADGIEGAEHVRWTGQCTSYSRLTTARYERRDIEAANGWPFDPAYRTRVAPGYRGTSIPATGPPEVRGQCLPKPKRFGHVIPPTFGPGPGVCAREICDGDGHAIAEPFLVDTPCYPGATGLIPPPSVHDTCGGHRCDGLGTCVPYAATALTSCDDADPCTYPDFCDGAGSCGGPPRYAPPRVCVLCTPPNNDHCACTSPGVCDPAGFCSGGIARTTSGLVRLGPILDLVALQPLDPAPTSIFDLFTYPEMFGIVSCRADNACLHGDEGMCYAGGLCGPFPAVRRWIPPPPIPSVNCDTATTNLPPSLQIDIIEPAAVAASRLGTPEMNVTAYAPAAVVGAANPGTPTGAAGERCEALPPTDPTLAPNDAGSGGIVTYGRRVDGNGNGNGNGTHNDTALIWTISLPSLWPAEIEAVTFLTAPFRSSPRVFFHNDVIFNATLGLDTIAYAVTSGTLPPNTYLNPTTGVITRPTSALSIWGAEGPFVITATPGGGTLSAYALDLGPFVLQFVSCTHDKACHDANAATPACYPGTHTCVGVPACGDLGHNCTLTAPFSVPVGIEPLAVPDNCSFVNEPGTGLEDQCLDVGALATCATHPAAVAGAPGEQTPMVCGPTLLPAGTPCSDDTPCTRDALSNCVAGVCEHHGEVCADSTAHVDCIASQECTGHYDVGTGDPVLSCAVTFLGSSAPCRGDCITRAKAGDTGRESGGICVTGSCMGIALVCTDTIGALGDVQCETIECDPSVVQTGAAAVAAAAVAAAAGNTVAERAWKYCRREATDLADGVALIDQSCSDNDACTLMDGCRGETTCQSGDVTRCSAPGPCEVAGICNPLTGECKKDPLPQGTVCDDGDPCTLDDACNGASVCLGRERDCNGERDIVPCGTITYFCEPIGNGVCVQAQLTGVFGSPCDDGDPCTVQDVCVGDEACEGVPVSCGSPQVDLLAGGELQCLDTAGTCTGTTTAGFPICSYGPLTGDPCNSGELGGCTVGDVCSAAGLCIAGPANQCASPPACHVGGAEMCFGGSCRYRPLPTTDPPFPCACNPSDAGDSACTCGLSPTTACTGECSFGFCVAVCDPPCPSGTECSSATPRLCTAVAASVCEFTDPLKCLRIFCGILDGADLSLLEGLEACVRKNVIRFPLGFAAGVVLCSCALMGAIAICIWLPLCMSCSGKLAVRCLTRGLPSLGNPKSSAFSWHRVKAMPAPETLPVATKTPVNLAKVVARQRANGEKMGVGGKRIPPRAMADRTKRE